MLNETLEEMLARLSTSARGLTTREALTRRRQLGSGAPVEASSGRRLLRLLRSAVDPLLVILALAAAASAILGQVGDAVIIAVIVAASGGLNAVQAFRSERAVRELRARIAPTATLLRDGQWVEVVRDEIVVGDVVRLAAGDIIPGDARLIEARGLHIQQSALTGESMPAEKAASNAPLSHFEPSTPELVYLGSSVLSGTGVAVVFATGSKTAFGDIIERLAARPDETEFERGTRKFGLLILKTVMFLILFILVVNMALGRDPLQSLLFSIALAVGLTPGFLPMITTVTLAQGAISMARENVIVKHLPSIQNLGSMDVLCSDKTGTLTAGTMSLDASLDAFGTPQPRSVYLAQINSYFESGIRSPLDAAILEHGTPDLSAYHKTDEIPFDFERRRLSIAVQTGVGFLLITKGAPESVLPYCTMLESGDSALQMDEQQRQRCQQVFLGLSAQGFRVIAVASKSVDHGAGFSAADESGLTLAGFLTFADHPQADVSESIEQLRADGVTVKILTGDNELVTRHICAKVGIDAERIVLGTEIDALDEVALGRLAERCNVFARVSPAQKHRVIRALKAAGHVVGYLGDGINDAPSLHAADVGISVAGAVDIAREASDIVLLDRRLSVLHAGIIAGRRSFANVLKYLLMGTSSNFGNMFSMAVAALFLPFMPMLPTQLLLNNLLYDLAQLSIPTDHVEASALRKPARWDIGLIRDFMLRIGPLSSVYDAITFVLLLRVFHFDQQQFRTGWFMESLATQTLVLFVIRTLGKSWSNRPSLPLTVTTLSVACIGLLLPYTPLAPLLGFTALPLTYFGFLFVVVASYLVLVETVKRRVVARLLAAG